MARTIDGRCTFDPPWVQICLGRERGGRSECEMESECFVECGLQFGGDRSDMRAYALESDRSDLLRLGFRVGDQPGVVRRKQHLKGVDAVGVGCDGDHGDHSAPKTLSGVVGTVVADDDRGSLLVGLGIADWLEIDESDVATSHQDWPSPAVASHRMLSSLASHVVQASS